MISLYIESVFFNVLRLVPLLFIITIIWFSFHYIPKIIARESLSFSSLPSFWGSLYQLILIYFAIMVCYEILIRIYVFLQTHKERTDNPWNYQFSLLVENKTVLNVKDQFAATSFYLLKETNLNNLEVFTEFGSVFGQDIILVCPSDYYRGNSNFLLNSLLASKIKLDSFSWVLNIPQTSLGIVSFIIKKHIRHRPIIKYLFLPFYILFPIESFFRLIENFLSLKNNQILNVEISTIGKYEEAFMKFEGHSLLSSREPTKDVISKKIDEAFKSLKIEKDAEAPTHFKDKLYVLFKNSLFEARMTSFKNIFIIDREEEKFKILSASIKASSPEIRHTLKRYWKKKAIILISISAMFLVLYYCAFELSLTKKYSVPKKIKEYEYKELGIGQSKEKSNE